jgi:two-component system, probable response regulator PhcQ
MTQLILLVDDEPHILSALQRSLRRVLREPDYRIETQTDPLAALARAADHAYALVISDYRMPGLDGVTLLTRLRTLQPEAARIILSGQADQQALLAAINQAQIARFIGKPWDDDALLAEIQAVLRQRDEHLETQRLADASRVQAGTLSPQELERRRLERLEPGITAVKWADDGSFILDEPPQT